MHVSRCSVNPRLARPEVVQELDLAYGTSQEDARIATAALFRDEARRLVGLLVLVTGDRAMSEDLAQEAFVRMHTAWPRLQSRDRATAYLRSTALNLARSRWRRLGVARRFRPEPPMPADAADDVAERNEERAAVLAGVRSLPGRQRDCVVLRYYCEMGPEQIADSLGLSVNSVKTHLRRGLAALHHRLNDRERA
jgi:RNA polymerase sigma-70 factor (sigma-E family)